MSNLSLKIDLNINSWITKYKDLNNEIIEKELNNYLFLGYKVSSLINVSCKDSDMDDKLKNFTDNLQNQCQQHFNRIDTKLSYFSDNFNLHNEQQERKIDKHSDDLLNAIQTISGKTNIPTHKGQIAENYIQNILSNAYPNDSVENLTSTAHNADLILSSDTYPVISIESKNYSNPVPYKEVTKFKFDLQKNNYKWGILLSFNQKIQNINSRFHVENFEGITIIYACLLNFNISDIILPVEFIKYLQLSNSGKELNMNFLNYKAKQISNTVLNLDKLHSIFKDNLNFFNDKRSIIEKSLLDIQTNMIQNQIQSEHIIREIRDKISSQVGEFTDTEKLQSKINFGDLPQKISEIMIGIQVSLPANINLIQDESGYYLTKNKKMIGCFKSTKSNLKFTLMKNTYQFDFPIKQDNISDFISLINN